MVLRVCSRLPPTNLGVLSALLSLNVQVARVGGEGPWSDGTFTSPRGPVHPFQLSDPGLRDQRFPTSPSGPLHYSTPVPSCLEESPSLTFLTLLRKMFEETNLQSGVDRIQEFYSRRHWCLSERLPWSLSSTCYPETKHRPTGSPSTSGLRLVSCPLRYRRWSSRDGRCCVPCVRRVIQLTYKFLKPNLPYC